MATTLDELKKAVKSLEEAINMPYSEIVRDGTIQRFEYTIELAWKVSKKLMGTQSTAPKVIIREMAQQNLIDDPKQWLVFLDDRNLSSHTYKEEIANQVYESAKKFFPEVTSLINKLELL